MKFNLKKLCISFIISACSMQISPAYKVTLITGGDLKNYCSYVAHQRITTFAAYPYLYKGDFAEELSLLTELTQWQHTALAIVRHDDSIIGFALGTALSDYDAHAPGVLDLFISSSLNPTDFYYLVEIIVAPAYQKQGIAKQLITAIERYGRSLGYSICCLACESHPEGHPQKPNNYQELDPLWFKLGYQASNLELSWTWMTTQQDGSAELQAHPMNFWIKHL